MKWIARCSLILVGLLTLNVSVTIAGVDEYLGDASIYSGVPSTKTRPNVLIIIDNSKATLNYAAGQAYKVKNDDGTLSATYPMKDGCTDGVESIHDECYLPWNIYEIDNQGDIANQVISANADYDIASLNGGDVCGVDDIVRKTLQKRGTYSAAGSEDYPIIKNNVCESAQNGAVYVLGNYLNYSLSTGTTTTPDAGDTVYCNADPVYVRYCSSFNSGTGECKNNNANFFQLIPGTEPPVGADYQPGLADGEWTNYWIFRGVDEDGEPSPDADGNPTWSDWSASTTYSTEYIADNPAGCVIPGSADDPAAGEEPVVDSTTLQTQREIMFQALEAAIESAAGAVNFGAMVYNKNNSGGQLVNAMADLSGSWPTDPTDPDKVILPDDFNCDQAGSYASTDICKFLGALPGSEWTGNSVLGVENNYPTVNSNTARPQGEAVYDAGYYFGAQYSPVALAAGTRVPEDIENECGLNHIILLTNGFTNGDSFNSGQVDTVVGDADLDGVDETVYGLGSHWMDDVAKYLQNYHGITTHTVLAFQERDELVEGTAKDGDGNFFNAYNAEELSAALLKLLAAIVNDADTSFVAPVVPASTTNRTISSNKVYLGLFRPQENEPWRGNVKKYGLSLNTYQLTDANHTADNPSYATDAYGNFDRDSISYWSEINGKIPAGNDAGYIDPNETDENKPKGDGGKVDAGGTGGVMLARAKLLAAAVRDNATWEVVSPAWRRIFTVIDPDEPLNSNANKLMPDSTVMTGTTAGLYNDAITPTMLGIPASAADPVAEKNALILYLHGFQYNELLTPSDAEARQWVMGDVLHSRPLVFNYDRYTEEGENYCTDTDVTDPDTGQTRTVKRNSSMIFVGANDGMLHAFNDCNGTESWAFIPPNVLDNLKDLKDPLIPGGHPMYVDAAPSLFVHDENENGTIDYESPQKDRVILVFGQRRGGARSATDGTYELDDSSSRGAYYALDVTNPHNPLLLWTVDFNDLGEIGETWSQPRLAKVPVDANSFKLVAFVGAGYDNNEDLRYGNTQTFLDATGVDINDVGSGGTVDGSGTAQTSTDSTASLAAEYRNFPRGRGIIAIEVATLERTDATSPYVVDLTDAGQIYWNFTYNASDTVKSQLKYSFASDLTVLDLNSDSFADTIYVGDTGGNLWRFKVDGADKTAWTGTIIFKSNPGADSSNGRKFFYRPQLAYVGAPHIYIGSGDREHPLNMATVDRMYCIIDWGQTSAVDETYLEDVTVNQIQDKDTDPADASALFQRLTSTPYATYNPNGDYPSDYTYGWYIRLDGVDHAVDQRDPNFGEVILGEKVLAQPTVFNGQVFFSTYQLITGSQAGCEAGNLGISRLYQLDYKTGEAVINFDTYNDITDGSTPTNDRAVGGENGELLQRTDRVRILGQGIPSGIVTIIDASGRVTQLISSSDKVEAGASTDIKLISPVYWMQW